MDNIDSDLPVNGEQRLLANDLAAGWQREEGQGQRHVQARQRGSSLPTHSGNRPMQRATYSLLTPPSWLRLPPNHAPSFFDAATVSAQTMTPDVRRSRRFDAAWAWWAGSAARDEIEGKEGGH